MAEGAAAGGGDRDWHSLRIGEGSARAFGRCMKPVPKSFTAGRGEASPFRHGAAVVTGFDLARRSLFKLLREGIPENWDKLGAEVE